MMLSIEVLPLFLLLSGAVLLFCAPAERKRVMARIVRNICFIVFVFGVRVLKQVCHWVVIICCVFGLIVFAIVVAVFVDVKQSL